MIGFGQRNGMMTEVWFSRVKKKDARLLADWWNGHVQSAQFTARKNGKYWDVLRYNHKES